MNPKEYNYDDISDSLLFVHQDVYLQDPEFLTNIENELNKSPNSIFGLAGITSSGTVFSNFKHRNRNQYIIRNQLSEKKEVVLVDECCFAMTKQLWYKIHFDISVCNH